eukprot:6174736-Pleurochrysis_carterae.AAC.3
MHISRKGLQVRQASGPARRADGICGWCPAASAQETLPYAAHTWMRVSAAAAGSLCARASLVLSVQVRAAGATIASYRRGCDAAWDGHITVQARPASR